jgi:hypothetical protein
MITQSNKNPGGVKPLKIKSLIFGLILCVTSLVSITSYAVMTDEGVDRTFPINNTGILSTNSTSGTPLTTIFAADNSFAGNTFDVQVLSSEALVINGFDVNLDNIGSTNAVSLYTRIGSSVGVENNAGDWTLAGTDAAVISAGLDSPSHVDISGIILQPGVTYGFYIDLASYDGISTIIGYTNGGPATYADVNLQITTNTGQASPAFSGSFFPRQVNTTLYYGPALPEIIPTLSSFMLILFSLMLAGIGFIVIRRNIKV